MGEPAGGGYCIPTLGAVCPIESAWIRTKFARGVPNWLMGMKTNVQAVKFTLSESFVTLPTLIRSSPGVPAKYRKRAQRAEDTLRG